MIDVMKPKGKSGRTSAGGVEVARPLIGKRLLRDCLLEALAEQGYLAVAVVDQRLLRGGVG